MSDLTSAPAFLKDRANLLLAAGRAGEYLEMRCEAAPGPAITLSVDEARELAEQFQRVTSLLTAIHLRDAQARARSAA